MNILYLSQNPAQIEAQFAGTPLSLAQAQPLRDDISTDEITPVAILSHYDATLGEFAHTGPVSYTHLTLPTTSRV